MTYGVIFYLFLKDRDWQTPVFGSSSVSQLTQNATLVRVRACPDRTIYLKTSGQAPTATNILLQQHHLSRLNEPAGWRTRLQTVDIDSRRHA